jgi:hypothetical protein
MSSSSASRGPLSVGASSSPTPEATAEEIAAIGEIVAAVGVVLQGYRDAFAGRISTKSDPGYLPKRGWVETKYGMSASGLFLLVLAAAVEPSEPARPPVSIAIVGEFPFSAEELEKALRARLPADVPAGTLSVSMRSDGRVEVSWQTMKREVDISNDSGGTAARVVALLAADLFVRLEPPSAPPIFEVVVACAQEPAREKMPSVAAGYELSSGGGKDSMLHGPSLGAGLDGRSLRLRASAGWQSSLPFSSSNLVTMTAWPFRIGVGAGLAHLSLIGSFVVAPYHLQGAVNFTQVLVGAAAEVEGRIAIAPGFSLRASAGADLFPIRSVLRSGNVTVFETDPVTLRIGLALAWGGTQ